VLRRPVERTDDNGAGQRNEALIRAVALGHDWRRKMERGIYPSIRALADAKGFSDSYAWKVIRLAYLAPDIIEAILDGRQPAHLILHKVNAAQLSGDWRSQRRALGFSEKS